MKNTLTRIIRIVPILAITFLISGTETFLSQAKTIYYHNGTDGNSTTVSLAGGEMKASDTTVRENQFVRNGYTFGGWYTAENKSGTKYAAGDKITGSGEIDLYAGWDIKNYDITYVLQGCTNVSNNKTSYTIEDKDFIISPAIVPKNFTFTGWTASTEGVKRPGLDVKILFSDDGAIKIQQGSYGNITLYADKKYTGNDKSGSFVMASETVVNHFAIGTAAADAFKKRYILNYDNGYIDPAYKGVEAGQSIDSMADSHRVIWPDEPASVADGSSFNLSNPTRFAYYLSGWRGKTLNNAEVEASVNINTGVNNVLNDTKIIPLWKPTEYTIHYFPDKRLMNWDNKSNPATYTILDNVTLQNPSFADMYFAGWLDDDDPSEKRIFNYQIKKGTTGDKYLTAQFSSGVAVTIMDYCITTPYQTGKTPKLGSYLGQQTVFVKPNQTVSGSVLGSDNTVFKYYGGTQYVGCSSVKAVPNQENICYRYFYVEVSCPQMRMMQDYSRPIVKSANWTEYYADGTTAASGTVKSGYYADVDDSSFIPEGMYVVFSNIVFHNGYANGSYYAGYDFTNPKYYTLVNVTQQTNGTYTSGHCSVYGEPGNICVAIPTPDCPEWAQVNGIESNRTSVAACDVFGSGDPSGGYYWVPIKEKVTAVLPDGTVRNPAESGKYPKGTKITISRTITDPSYKGCNWKFENGTTSITNTHTTAGEYEQWNGLVWGYDDRFIIQFDLNGGYAENVSDFADKAYNCGEKTKITSVKPLVSAKSGLVFKGWALTRAGIPVYQAGGTYTIKDKDGYVPTHGKKIKLYAIWG